jgi:hypothetical protein
MVDHPRPGPPDDAARDAALRMLVDALTAPGTPEELAGEHTYLQAFRTLSMSAKAAAAARRRRRLRLAAVGGFAALAVTSTAAAITGTYPGAQPDPSRQSMPLHQSTASSAPRAGTTAPQPGGGRAPTAPVAPTTGGGTDAPPASASPSASESVHVPGSPAGSANPTPVVSGAPVTPSASPNASTTPSPVFSPSPTPSAGQEASPDAQTLTAYCVQYLNGKVKKGSRRWHVLVLAAGAEGKVRSYCQGLVGAGGATGADSTATAAGGATTDG